MTRRGIGGNEVIGVSELSNNVVAFDHVFSAFVTVKSSNTSDSLLINIQRGVIT